MYGCKYFIFQMSDAMNEAAYYIDKEADPPWLRAEFISEEIGRLISFVSVMLMVFFVTKYLALSSD